jgi:hypothetical protein
MGSSPDWYWTWRQSADSVTVDEEDIWNQWFGGSFWALSEGQYWARHKAALLVLPKLIIWGSVKNFAVEKAAEAAWLAGLRYG